MAAESTVALSRSHGGGADDLVRRYLPGQTALPAGGAGYKALLVAAGKAGAYLHVTKSKLWDVCAPEAFMDALGGKLTDAAGGDIVYDARDPVLRRGFVGAASTQKHAWLVERLRSHPVNLQGEAGEVPAESSFIHDRGIAHAG